MKKPKLKLNIEQMVITDLQKTGKTLMLVLDRDTQAALNTKENSELIASINVNLRTLAAVNEVLMYYGDSGVFAGNL